MNILPCYHSLLSIIVFNMSSYCLKYTTSGSNTYFMKWCTCLLFKFFLNCTNSSRHSSNIMNLSIQHCTCLMLSDVLSNYDKFILFCTISNCTHNITGTNIESKYIVHASTPYYCEAALRFVHRSLLYHHYCR